MIDDSNSAWISELATELAGLDEQGRRRVRREVLPLPGGRCSIHGKTLWNFAANDYLGIADDPRLRDAAIAAIQTAGLGARASALVTGRTPWHAQLEERLARFKRAEAAILFPTGYAANVGTIAALVGSDDVVLCDRLNHASLIDGCRLSRAKLQVIAHADPSAYEKQLALASGFRRRLIVTDSVFSMDGDYAPLTALAALAEQYDALLLIDEAHATGVNGQHGTGLQEQLGVHSPRIISVGTLSKAAGLQGGFVTGSQTLIDWLWNSARTQMFSTALSIPVCAAAIAALDIIEAEPQRREWLAQASRHVITQLRSQGWQVPDSAQGPIIPIIIGDEAETMRLAGELERHGLLIAAIRPPTVPKGTSRLRISLSHAHGEEAIETLIAGLRSVHRPHPS
ncbi:8-amino-7-oxononanoate synthase [Planctomicrobium piriforme]|uniref:8-amino-7-oxononanoate synthase n=1 Tax=Planctomicrobium piriforme TaxID=1576369 RepID=A0A1I3T5V4_9PLAN|nr:8-amino-7-oxononanoate synthase [Planctomicrobium piriforme]SFJ65036.1 8-amino-7-oxononanoate synthase [Planctomicrobium piriforme]